MGWQIKIIINQTEQVEESKNMKLLMLNLKMDRFTDITESQDGENIKQDIVLMEKKKEKKQGTSKMEIFITRKIIKMI